eukprot:1629909-Rhodomonas_salina.3
MLTWKCGNALLHRTSDQILRICALMRTILIVYAEVCWHPLVYPPVELADRLCRKSAFEEVAIDIAR